MLAEMSSQSIQIPPGAKSIDQILDEARTHIQRLTTPSLLSELQATKPAWGPTHLIDIRPAAQRAMEGAFELPAHGSGSNLGHKIHIIERNVLEWRLDPQSEARIKKMVDLYRYETRVVVICSEGYTSSLAASELQRLGLKNATDLDGGYWAWRAALDEKGGESPTP